MVQEKGGWGLESGSQKGTFLQFTWFEGNIKSVWTKHNCELKHH
jgi:hypothetical protein